MAFETPYRIYPLKLYVLRLPVMIFGGLSALLNLACWVWLWMQIPGNGEQLFLHYNILFGVDKIGESWKVFYVPLLGFVVLVINSVAGWIFYRQDKLMSYVLHATSLLCQIFIMIAVFLLILLNV